jgi:CRISPR/Cas system-associated exonuclease Cas4 (RecB family)
MEITVDQIHTYLNCPLKYRFKHVDGMNVQEVKNVRFKKAVHKTISYFFLSVMSGRLPSLANMKDKWANTWEELGGGSMNGIQDLLSVSQSLMKKESRYKDQEDYKYRITGFEMIHNFYQFNKDNPGSIIGVDLDYRVPIGDAIVIGKFELIREIVDASDGKRYIEIVDFKASSDDIDPFLVKNDLSMGIASYAFRNLFGSAEDRLKYHYLKTGRDIIITKRENDFERMKATVNGVHTSITNKLLYPRQTHMCKVCEFKDVCDRVRF